MEEPKTPRSLLDRLVERGIEILDSLGMNGPRLRWRWNRYREQLSRRRLDAANRVRGITGKHRMCPSCRALLPVSERVCTECGQSLAGVPGPGIGRLMEWLLPGIPRASAILLTANFAIFLLIALRAGFAAMETGGGMFATLFRLLAFSGDTLMRYGAGNNYLLFVAGTGTFLTEEWWRLICPVFLHGGLVHLLFNTFIFVQIGPLVEQEYGKAKFFVLYLWCGVLGFVASELLRFWLHGPTARGFMSTVGASGAIFGLVGAALVYGGRRGGAFGQHLRATMTRWAIYFAIWTFLIPGIDAYAHFGGMAAGAAFAAGTDPAPPRGQAAVLAWRIAAVAGIAVVLAAFLLAGLKGNDSLDAFRSLRG